MSTYVLYYLDNDRQKIVLVRGLKFQQAWKEANRLSLVYNSTVFYEAE